MAWMVSIVLILFYAVGKFAFHETSLIAYLPYIAGGVLLVDYLLARFSRRSPDPNS
jgi:hypothetical protein